MELLVNFNFNFNFNLQCSSLESQRCQSNSRSSQPIFCCVNTVRNEIRLIFNLGLEEMLSLVLRTKYSIAYYVNALHGADYAAYLVVNHSLLIYRVYKNTWTLSNSNLNSNSV